MLDPKAKKELEAAVRCFIQQKRQRTIPPEVRPTLQDRRSFEKDNIAAVIRDHKHLLVGINSIMKKALRGKERCRFRRSPTLGAFCDGFRVDSALFKDTHSLQRFLKDHDLNVMMPQAANESGSRFVQLADEPFDLEVNHAALKKAAIALKEKQ